jgi:hypothetical protein
MDEERTLLYEFVVIFVSIVFSQQYDPIYRHVYINACKLQDYKKM